MLRIFSSKFGNFIHIRSKNLTELYAPDMVVISQCEIKPVRSIGNFNLSWCTFLYQYIKIFLNGISSACCHSLLGLVLNKDYILFLLYCQENSNNSNLFLIYSSQVTIGACNSLCTVITILFSLFCFFHSCTHVFLLIIHITASISSFDFVPTEWFLIFPSLITNNVGILIIWNRLANSGSSSTLTVAFASTSICIS